MFAKTEFQVGAASVAIGIFLLVVGIPYGISSPSNVPKIVLSPVFWPQILAGALILIGIGLLISAPGAPRFPEQETTIFNKEGGINRLALMALTMVVYAWAIDVIGMVWASMIVFAIVAFLVKTRHPYPALAAAVVVPLALYAFFNHVASVSIPQGDFVRLP
ncbi:MAG TPA: tripartite tricarboxylate transporter TctB family protein [Thermohalobaculum sp.]|nr:tripartite tricarboxylate transporter TctB family protein [Thermohalobaculum sp.]